MTTMLMILSMVAKGMIETWNPVKLSMYLMVMSAGVFLAIHMISGKTWFPMIYFMLFMGGVLIMFMILSSLMPNEKMIKNQSLGKSVMKITTIAAAVSIVHLSLKIQGMEPEMVVKMELSQSTILIFMMLMILAYFVVFMGSMENMKTPLKSQSCRNKKKIL